MKIVCTDNFNREAVADFLVAENIQVDTFAQCMCAALQEKYGGNNSPHFFQVKADDYKLWRGMEELV